MTAASLATLVVAALLHRLAGGPDAAPESGVFYVPLALSALALATAQVARGLVLYYAARVVRALTFLLTVPFTLAEPLVAFLLLASALAETAFFEPYPASLAASLALTAAAAAFTFLLAPAPAGASWATRLALPLLTAASGAAVSFFACHMTRFREEVVDLAADRERLTDSLIQLARASSAYQDLAIRAQESATEKERQRIARDIHDIVGYTLTNNVMLLEAALDLMQENPLGLPAIIETARENAEEGLARVRSAMHELRRQEQPYPRGATAIHRLGRVFEQATSIRVRCEFGNLPQNLPEKIDSAIYHLVQECLVNSFRHAHAAEVRVLFRWEAGVIHVRISDDGVGTRQQKTGIGLQGMRERVEALGGAFEAGPWDYGFTVEASLPCTSMNLPGEIQAGR